MNTSDFRNILITVFTRLRRSGFELGVGELLTAIQVVESDFGIENEEQLQHVIRLLWCKLPEEQARFDDVWKEIIAVSPLEQERNSDGII